MSLLEKPLQFPARSVERYNAGCIQIRSRAIATKKIRRGVTGAEVHHIENGVEGGGSPNRRSTVLPTNTSPRSGFSGPETPQELTRGRSVCVQMTAHPFIATRNANNHFLHC